MPSIRQQETRYIEGADAVEAAVTLRRPRPKKLATTLKPSALLFSCVKNLSCMPMSQSQQDARHFEA